MMKKIYLLFVLMLISCNKFDNTKFKILPSAQKIDFNNTYSNLNHNSIFTYYSKNNNIFPVTLDRSLNFVQGKDSDSTILFSIDGSLNIRDEGYVLNIKENQIIINAKDNAGLFYAVNTLSQLLQDSKDQNINLPLVDIEDFPSLSYRSIHLDIKHHTEKKEYYFNLIDELASIKINGIIVEFEDKLGYEKRPLVASEDSYTIDWWIELSEYAFQRNIQISPLVQGLGHASFILKHDKFKELRDVPEKDWAFNPLNPKTYELQFDLYQDAIKATPHGKYLHVGGDEVKVVDRDGKKGFELNLIWLKKVSKFAEENNRIPIFWDDMYLKHGGVWMVTRNTKLTKDEVNNIWIKNSEKLTEYIDDFPKNLIYMRWNYFSPWANGNLKTIDWYKENNMKVMGATAGQTRWILMPQDNSNIEAIKSFSLTSVDKKLDGLLLTLWDDDSPHFELYKRGIYAFAEYTWGGKNLDSGEFKLNFRHRFFSPKLINHEFIDKLDNPVKDWPNLFVKEKKHRNKISKNKNSLETHIINLPDTNNKGIWSVNFKEKISNAKLHSKNIETILSDINYIKTHTLRGNYTLDVYEQVAKLLKFSYNAILLLDQFDNGKVSKEKLFELENQFVKIREEFELVYSKTRNINKPKNYIKDKDQHNHTANQSLNMDWQFIAELKLFEKIDMIYEKD